MRTHLAAAEAWLSGNPVLAAESYAFILSRWPSDLLALRLAQSCYFFLGQHDRFCKVVDSVAQAWTDDQRGHWAPRAACAARPFPPGGERQSEFPLERAIERGFGFIADVPGNADDRNVALPQLRRAKNRPPSCAVLHRRRADEFMEPLADELR